MNMKSTSRSKLFFDSISRFYDEMISFKASLKKRQAFYEKILRPDINYGADIGCGTGLDSVALCKNGLKVTAFDISPMMINAAKRNAAEEDCRIKFICSDADGISKKMYGKFDIVVSMGNTLANLSPLKLGRTARLMHDLLRESGILVIQVLNFDKIVRENKRIINIKKIPGKYTVRFYDIHDHYLIFNILNFGSVNTSDYELKTTYLYPYSRTDLSGIFGTAGFNKIKFYGSLQMERFNSGRSNDLFMMARS